MQKAAPLFKSLELKREYMDLTDYKIFDSYGIKNITLDGKYDENALAQKLIDEWIPYIDCERKCPRSDFCKYTKPHPHFPDRLTDIKCGVGVETLKNFIKFTFHIFEKLSNEKVENYLGGAFYLLQFVLSTERAVGLIVDEDYIKSYDDYAPALFGHITKLRDELNKIGVNFKHIPEFRSTNGVLFLEGWSEKAFLEKLRESHSTWFLNLNLEVYNGKGNRRPKRIQMLLDDYRKNGYQIYIQGDADGQYYDIFENLISVDKDCTFIFQYDFESAIPPKLFLFALHELGELSGIEIDEFTKKIYPLNCSVNKKVNEIFRINCDSLKLDIATIVAEILNNPRTGWWYNEEFLKTELGRFLEFIQKIK